MNRRSILAFLFLATLSVSLIGQSNTFQKIYSGIGSTKCHQSILTDDGGILMAGFANNNLGVERFFLSKTDCQGNVDWHFLYENTSSLNNPGISINQTTDGDFFVCYNTGTPNAYEIVALKLDEMGVIQWKNIMLGARNDKIHRTLQTADGGFLLVGTTNTYGQDSNSSVNAYKDVYVVRLDRDGEELWSRTFGQSQTIEEAWDVVQASNGLYAVTGRYGHNDATYAFLMYLDDAGQALSTTVYGLANHRTIGYGIANSANGQVVITGSTTVNKEDFDANPDAFLLQADLDGSLTWAQSYAGSDTDGSDIGTSVVPFQNGFAMAIASMSYPTTGFVPNKHILMQTDAQGDLTKTVSYVNGSGHFPSIRKNIYQAGLLLSGFSNENSLLFKPHLTRINEALSSGCSDIELTNLTVQQVPVFDVSSPTVNTGTGSNWVLLTNQLSTSSFESINTLCEEINDIICEPLMTESTSIEASFSVGDVVPNPAIDQVQIELMIQESGVIQTEVYSQTGVLLSSNSSNLFAGSQWHNISLDHLTNGLYLIKMNFEEQIVSRKVMVMRY